MYVDSYMVLDSKMLPEQARTGKVNSRIPLSTDNIIFMYIYGIQDFKRITPENHKSIIKLNGINNPYAEAERLTTTFKILPIVPSFEMNDKGKPYVQYTVFVRNSDWAEPYVK
jgi:hypothetical protein